MNANELRVGNLLRRKAPFNDICWLGNVSEQPFVHHDNGGTHHYLSQLEPIPITEELLPKIGFIEYETREGEKGYRYSFLYTIKEYRKGEWLILHYDREFEIARVSYVHQWQNLFFALRQDEVSIKLS